MGGTSVGGGCVGGTPGAAATGGPGTPGRNLVGEPGREVVLPPKTTRQLDAGEVVTVVTPGGGGWGQVG